jgi:ketosteroid isomerase-like protein
VQRTRRGSRHGARTENLGELLTFLDEDLVTRSHAGPNQGTWHGVEGFLDMTADVADYFDEFTLRGEEFIDAGDQVVVRVVSEGRGADSRTPVTGTFWFAYGVRGRKIATIDMYATREAALEAAGLEE